MVVKTGPFGHRNTFAMQRYNLRNPNFRDFGYTIQNLSKLTGFITKLKLRNLPAGNRCYRKAE